MFPTEMNEKVLDVVTGLIKVLEIDLCCAPSRKSYEKGVYASGVFRLVV